MRPPSEDADRVDTTPFARWSALAIFTAIYICQQYDRAIMSIVQEPVKHAFALTDTQIGLLGGLAHGGMYALFGIPVGLMLDRSNRRLLLAGMLVVWSATTALAAFATGFATLLICRMMVGASEAGGYPAMLSLTAAIFPRRQHGTAMGILGMGSSAGIILTLLLGGMIVQTHGWRAGFLTAALPGILLAILLVWRVAEPPRTRGSGQSDGRATLAATLGYILSQRSLVLCMLGSAAASAALAGFWAWAVSFMVRLHGLPLAQVGVGLAIGAGGAGMLGALVWGIVSDRIGAHDPRRRLLLVAVTSALCIPVGGVALTTGSSVLALSLLPMFIVLGVSYSSVGAALAANLVPAGLRGTTMSIMSILNNALGAGMGPLAVGFMSDRIGGPEALRYALLLLVSCYLLAALCFLAAMRTVQADMSRAIAGDRWNAASHSGAGLPVSDQPRVAEQRETAQSNA